LSDQLTGLSAAGVAHQVVIVAGAKNATLEVVVVVNHNAVLVVWEVIAPK
jgi:hypothetical protein